MHVKELLHKWLDNACLSVDKRLRRTLFSATETLTRCKALSIFGLGRHLNRAAIVALAVFVLWILGTAAKQKQLHYSFQANTEKRRNVLSIFTIGWQALQRKVKFSKKELFLALQAVILSTQAEAIPC